MVPLAAQEAKRLVIFNFVAAHLLVLNIIYIAHNNQTYAIFHIRISQYATKLSSSTNSEDYLKSALLFIWGFFQNHSLGRNIKIRDKSLMLEGIVLLLSLLGLVSGQWSYVPSRMFASYQFKCINVNNNNASLTISNDSNPYILSLEDVHNNVQSHHVALGGLSNQNDTNSAYQISIVASTLTQYVFTLTVQGYSSFGQMQFFLILIGNEATGYIQAHTFNETFTLTSTNSTAGHQDVSPSRVISTSMPSPYNVAYFLTYFHMTQTQGGTEFDVGIDHVNMNLTNVQFQYYVDRGNTLSSIGLVILIYNSPASMPTNVTYFGVNTNTYSNNLNNANTAAPATSAYSTGFNRKCLLGLTNFPYAFNEYFRYDINNLISSLVFSSSWPAFNGFRIFCMVQNFNCSIIDSNCLECLSHSKCSSCESHYYVQEYPNTTATCLLCAGAITGCDICTNTSICLSCIAPTYLFSGSGCNLCSAYIANCSNCTDNATCIGCLDYYGLLNSSYCSLCSNLLTGCQLCSSPSVCTLCYNGYYLSGSTCLKCNTGVDNCAVCLSATICTLCFSDSYLSSDNLTCVCNSGMAKISGLCASVGCSSAYRFNSTTYCLSCNASLHFYYSSYNCFCSTGYLRQNDLCVVICGDGLLVSEGCDDGNVVSGDGCSDTCTVQANYICVNGSITSKSVCYYASPIAVDLVDVVKLVDSNTAEITLSISPNIRLLKQMNFSKYLQLDVSGRSVTYTSTYNADGTLTVLVQYSDDLEGRATTLTLAYDPTLVGLPPQVLKFNMVGHNDPINYSSLTGLENIVLNLGYAVVGLFFIQLIISMVVHKLIGLETMQVLQVVFFSRYLLANSGPMAVYNMHSINYINGYNPFTKYTNILNLDSSLLRLGLGKNLVFNIMVPTVLIALFWVISWCYSLKVANRKAGGAESTSTGIEQLKKLTVMEYKISTCAFIITTYTFFILCFSLTSSLQENDQVYYQLPRLLVVFALFVFFYSALYLTGQMFLSWKLKYDEEEGILHKYIAVFIFFQMLLATITIGLQGLSYGHEIVAGVQLVYLVVLIVMRPYYLPSQNVMLVACQFVSLAFCTFLAILDYVSLSDTITTYVVLGFEGLLIAVGVIAIIRLYFHSKFNMLAFKKLHELQDKLQGKDIFSKKEFQKQQEELIASKSKKPTFTQQKILNQQMQKDELTQIKARLKGEFKQKKMEEMEESIYEGYQ